MLLSCALNLISESWNSNSRCCRISCDTVRLFHCSKQKSASRSLISSNSCFLVFKSLVRVSYRAILQCRDYLTLLASVRIFFNWCVTCSKCRVARSSRPSCSHRCSIISCSASSCNWNQDSIASPCWVIPLSLLLHHFVQCFFLQLELRFYSFPLLSNSSLVTAPSFCAVLLLAIGIKIL
jgi:hypothetical protein